MINRYHLSGYIFETNVAIPELISTIDTPDCYINVCESVSPAIPAEAFDKPFYSNEELKLVCVKREQLGFIAIWNNKVLEYTPPVSFSNARIKMQLLGSVAMIMSAFLGYTSFHAASVIINNKAVLFCGTSGAGKSSIAAHFYTSGYTVLSDDVTTVKLSSGGDILAYPSVPRIKLSDKSLAYLGKTSEGLNAIEAPTVKYSLPVVDPIKRQPCPVGAIVLPAFRSGPIILEVLSGFRSKLELHKHLYRKRTAKLISDLTKKDQHLFNIATRIPMYNFYRPKDDISMQQGFAFLEDELSKILG